MPVKFSTNAQQLQQRFLQRAAGVDASQRRANVEIARVLTKAGKNNLQEDVYSVPVRATQKARSGLLLVAERWVVRGRSVRHENAVFYAIYRYRYGRPEGQRQRAPYRLWRGPRFVLGSQSGIIRQIRLRHFRQSLRKR